MIWPVQKTGLPYNIVRFPNGPHYVFHRLCDQVFNLIQVMYIRSGGHHFFVNSVIASTAMLVH